MLKSLEKALFILYKNKKNGVKDTALLKIDTYKSISKKIVLNFKLHHLKIFFTK